MKQLLLTSTLALASAMATGQANNYPNGSTVADFTVTDTDGNTHSLYSYTSAGQYVMLDFFFDTCPPCQATSPYFSELHQTYGCNEGDLFCLAVNNGTDNDAMVEAYEATYGGPFAHPPAASADGGGGAVTSTFGVMAFPTYVLIGPDNTMIVNDIWPVSNMNTFVAAFPSGSGISAQACAVGIQEASTAGSMSVFPSLTTGIVTVDLDLQGARIVSLEVVDLLGQHVLDMEVNTTGQQQLDLGVLGDGQYVIRLLADGVVADVKRITLAR